MSKEYVCDVCGEIIGKYSSCYRVKVKCRHRQIFVDGWFWYWKHLCQGCWREHEKLVRAWNKKEGKADGKQ